MFILIKIGTLLIRNAWFKIYWKDLYKVYNIAFYTRSKTFASNPLFSLFILMSYFIVYRDENFLPCLIWIVSKHKFFLINLLIKLLSWCSDLQILTDTNFMLTQSDVVLSWKAKNNCVIWLKQKKIQIYICKINAVTWIMHFSLEIKISETEGET